MGCKSFSSLIIGLAFILSGCITEFTPTTETIELSPGESQTFTATSVDTSAALVWYLNGEQVAYDTALYVFTAGASNGDTPVLGSRHFKIDHLHRRFPRHKSPSDEIVQIGADQTLVYKLTVREENSRYQKYFEYMGLPDDYVHSITWTIRVTPTTGEVTCYLDEDGDGFGAIGKAVTTENPPDNCVDNSDDCDDDNAAVNPDAEDQCDGVDNNCDGSLDPDGCCTDGDTQSTTCGLGDCAATGVVTCVNGAWDWVNDTCEPAPAGDEVCDGLDNDCNGLIDDGIASSPSTCGIGECAATGATACVAGAMVDTCTPGTPTAEIADGLDNDCDGATDEDLSIECTAGDPDVAISCGIGACAATGIRSCVDGYWVDHCVPGTPTAESCDGIDNNCNGTVDDGIAATPTVCGVGECGATGVMACVDGAMIDSCVPGQATQEVCDGKDNNCNGTVDDGIAETQTTCGVGECGATGVMACVDGAMIDSCVPGQATQEVCDGKDNNCNGTVDDGIAETQTTCGVGECGATGIMACVDGAMIDSCVPGQATQEICDGKDNNCNGTVDDDIAQTQTTCGVGECGATGVTTCVDGAWIDSCVPGAAAAEVCFDGLDNDCDGKVDNGCSDTAGLAEEGLNLLIDYLQAYMISGEVPASIEDILPPAAVADIRDNYFQAVLDDDSGDPAAHFGLAVMELVNIAYDVDSVAIIDFLLNMLTGADAGATSELGGMASMLFDVLDSSAADYLATALGHLNYAANLSEDIVLKLYMPKMVVDGSGNPVIDPETGRPQFVKDTDGNLVFETQKTSYQLDRTDMLMIRGVVEFAVSALHLYNAYDINLADASGSYDYLNQIVLKDPETEKPDIQSFQGLLLALEYNDKRDGFLTMLPGGASEAQASKPVLLEAIADVRAALDSLAAETDDQIDDIITLERMAYVYTSIVDLMTTFLPDLNMSDFSIANFQALLDKFTSAVNSTASNRFPLSLEVQDIGTIDMSLDLSRVFSGAITDLHQYLPYRYWFYLDQSTAYPPSAPSSWANTIDGMLGGIYGLTIPFPLYKDANTPVPTEAELAAYPYLMGPRAITFSNGLIQFTGVDISILELSIGMSAYFPDLTFGGIIQGLTQDEIDAVMDSVMSTVMEMKPTN